MGERGEGGRERRRGRGREGVNHLHLKPSHTLIPEEDEEILYEERDPLPPTGKTTRQSRSSWCGHCCIAIVSSGRLSNGGVNSRGHRLQRGMGNSWK